MSRKSVYTTFETAKLCHVSPLSIINWVNAGRLPAFRTPGGHRRIRREDLVRFMRDNGIPLPEELREGSGKWKVLVVDDEASIREVLAEHLTTRANSYEVLTAADGAPPRTVSFWPTTTWLASSRLFQLRRSAEDTP